MSNETICAICGCDLEAHDGDDGPCNDCDRCTNFVSVAEMEGEES